MSNAFDFASGLGGLNLSMATDADDESFNSVTPRPAATRGSTRSSVTVSDVFVSPVSRLSTGVSVGAGSVNKSVSLFTCGGQSKILLRSDRYRNRPGLR
jgi:hypothetical protein